MLHRKIFVCVIGLFGSMVLADGGSKDVGSLRLTSPDGNVSVQFTIQLKVLQTLLTTRM